MGENSVVTERTSDYIKIRSSSGTEEVYYSTFYEGIPEEFLGEARKTLNETEENKWKGMHSLRAFAKREDLTCTDDDLLLVLRVAKFNLKKAEKKLKNYLKLRQKIRKLVSNMDDSKTDVILDDLIFSVFPYRDKDGRLIFTSNTNVHLDLYEPDDVDPIALSLLLYVCTLPLTTVTGLNYLAECKTDNFYVLYPIIKQAKKTYISLVLDLPMRIGRIDYMNENVLVRWFFKLVRTVAPKKFLDRLIFHGDNYEALKEAYNPEILPEEFGGNLGPLSDKHFRQKLLNFMQKLKEENRLIEKRALQNM